MYIIALPAFGLISHIIPNYTSKTIFGPIGMISALISISILSFLVYAHHLFNVGLSTDSRAYFSAATLVIAIPTALKIFSWLATIFGGATRTSPPMLFALAFLTTFTAGGLSGIVLANGSLHCLTTWQLLHYSSLSPSTLPRRIFCCNRCFLYVIPDYYRLSIQPCTCRLLCRHTFPGR